MKSFRRLCLSVSALLMSVAALGAFNCLTINRIDGKTDHFALDRTTSVSLVADGVKLSGLSVTVIYPIKEVDTYSFENYTFASGVKYDGDKDDVSSIAEAKVVSDLISLSAENGVLTVRGAAPGADLKLVNIKGTEVDASRAASDGSATLSVVSGGVYLLTVNGVTFKVIL